MIDENEFKELKDLYLSRKKLWRQRFVEASLEGYHLASNRGEYFHSCVANNEDDIYEKFFILKVQNKELVSSLAKVFAEGHFSGTTIWFK